MKYILIPLEEEDEDSVNELVQLVMQLQYQ